MVHMVEKSPQVHMLLYLHMLCNDTCLVGNTKCAEGAPALYQQTLKALRQEYRLTI